MNKATPARKTAHRHKGVRMAADTDVRPRGPGVRCAGAGCVVAAGVTLGCIGVVGVLAR